MAFQTYIVCCEPQLSIAGVKEVAAIIQGLGGLILLATRQNLLLVGFDDAHVERVRRHAHVTFVGGVTLDPRGAAATQLYAMVQDSIRRQVPSAELDHRPLESTADNRG